MDWLCRIFEEEADEKSDDGDQIDQQVTVSGDLVVHGDHGRYAQRP